MKKALIAILTALMVETARQIAKKIGESLSKNK